MTTTGSTLTVLTMRPLRRPGSRGPSPIAVKVLAILGSVVVGLFALLEPALADYQYDWGVNPALAGGSNTLVEVHQAGDGVGPLWYRVGHVFGQDDATVTVQWDNSSQYDDGINPAVAMSGSYVVEVHQGWIDWGPLWYRVGEFFYAPGADRYVLLWSASHQYDQGAFPAVAVDGSSVIEVHQANAGPGPLWYRTGQIQNTNAGLVVAWNSSFQYDNWGAHPKVSLLSEPLPPVGTPTLIEVHQEEGDFFGVGPLRYFDGYLLDHYSAADSGYISWSNPLNIPGPCGRPNSDQVFGVGMSPAVALSKDYVAVLGFQKTDGVGELAYFDAPELPGYCADIGVQIGVHPAIATWFYEDHTYLVKVHQGQTGVGPLWYSILVDKD